MWKSHKYLILALALLTASAAQSFAQEAQLIAVLRSEATLHEKSTACRQLARVGTKEAVPALAALLGDEKLSHMARYALESIPDPSVDEALREALGKVQGRPRLGVIGSLGVRRDAQAVDALAALLKDPETSAAAARALGQIGTTGAAKALEEALDGTSGTCQLGICEGLFRCAEALTAAGENARAQAIYDRVRGLPNAAQQVRAAALRGAILSRGAGGAALIVEALQGADYVLAAAAIRAAMELPAPEITDALVAELPQASAERQGLVILALADRHEARVLPAVLQVAQKGDRPLRLVAFRALRRVGDASCVPVLLETATQDDAEVARAAQETLENLQDKSVDEQLAKCLAEAEGKTRMMLIDLAGRRRTAAAVPALWQAADDSDGTVRCAALASLGAMLQTSDLPKLIARLASTKDDREAAALDKALCDVCLRSENREPVAAQLAAALPNASGPVKARILETLNTVGGAASLAEVVAATRSSDTGLRNAAFRVLGQWKSADAAPTLLELQKTLTDERLKSRAIRAYIRIARQFDLPADQRAAMCRTALEIAQSDDDKRLVLEVLLRYPSDEMQAIAEQAAKVPALKDEAALVLLGMTSKGIDRAELGKALARAGHTPVKLELLKAEYGAGDKSQDVTAILRKYAKNYSIIFLPSMSYNESFGDPAPGVAKRLTIQYRINDKAGEVSLTENAIIVLPVPK